MPISTVGNLNNQRGFTLIELGIVVVLIGLFTVISVPLLDTGGRDDVRAAARRLAGTIKYLFNEAALTGLEHRLIYNLDRDSYQAKVRESDGQVFAVKGIGSERRLRKGVHFQRLALPGRGSFNSGEVTVRIDPSGWLEETLILLSGDGDYRLTVLINPLTGAAEIIEGRQRFDRASR